MGSLTGSQTGLSSLATPEICLAAMLGCRPWYSRLPCGCWGIWTPVLKFIRCMLSPTEPSPQPEVQSVLFDSLVFGCFFLIFYYCPHTALWFVCFYYSWEGLLLRGKEQMYFRGMMWIVTKIVINCSVMFYKQEQSYIFEVRNHLLSLDVENKVIWYINQNGEINGLSKTG